MSIFIKNIVAGALVGISATTASAAMVTYTMVINEDGPGTFNVYADASHNDNLGLASYGLVFTGDVTTIDNKAPQGTVLSSSFIPTGETLGFTLQRSKDFDVNNASHTDEDRVIQRYQ